MVLLFCPSGSLVRSFFFGVLLLCFFCFASFSGFTWAASSSSQENEAFHLPQGVGAGTPILRILYVASTQGETLPCPVCRGAPPGGLARRAGLFDMYRRQEIPLLVLAGPDEFLTDPASDGSMPMPSLVDGKIALQAYSALKVDAGWLSPEAAAWMKTAGGGIPSGFTRVDTVPQSLLLQTPAGPVGVVLFPRGERYGSNPSKAQQNAALDAGKALQKKAFLVLGVSPWGYQLEKDFLPRAEGVFSCLLGSGPGITFSHAIAAGAPGILWVRSDTKGRSVTEVNLLTTPPSPGAKKLPEWMEGISFSARLISLDRDIPENKDVAALVRKD